jgi:DNA-binding NarL/FixJ family response regulator
MGMNEKKVSVLLADDHPLVLTGLRRALERSDEIEVAGEAGTVNELMALIDRRRPQVVLLDLNMPGVRGTEHIEHVATTWPEVKVVVLSASEDRPSIDAALKAGATAFVVKSVGLSDIAGIVRQIAGGAVFHAPGQVAGRSAGAEPIADGPGLTERERAILKEAARGLTAGGISRELWISEHTVKFHLTNIYRKLGVSNRAGAIRWAVENGLDEL